MSPQKDHPKKENLFSNHQFSGDMLVYGEVLQYAAYQPWGVSWRLHFGGIRGIQSLELLEKELQETLKQREAELNNKHLRFAKSYVNFMYLLICCLCFVDKFHAFLGSWQKSTTENSCLTTGITFEEAMDVWVWYVECKSSVNWWAFGLWMFDGQLVLHG